MKGTFPMSTQTLSVVLFGTIAVIAAECSAQPGILSIAHNDADGVVEPGQVVRIQANLAKPAGAAFLWEIRGDLLASPKLGIGSNNRFPYPGSNGSAIVNMGTIDGASVRGVHIHVNDQLALSGTTGPWPPWGWQSFGIVQYEWTAPTTPGVVEFNWQPSPDLPEIWYALPQIWTTGPIPTTYVGTSLTVVPAPASGVLLAGGLLLIGRRRR